jgi:hypothetical protein
MNKISYIIAYLKSLEFADKGYLFLLLLIPLLIGFYIWKHKKHRQAYRYRPTFHLKTL